jgi:hypothetical protein
MRWGSVLLVGIIFAALYTAEGILFRDYNLDEFQVATAYLKDQEPVLFPTDFIWSQAEMVRNLHVCVRGMMRFTDILTLGSIKEPIDLFLVWLPVCFLLFFIGNYLLSWHFTRHHWVSLLIACSFMLVRRTVWDWWGIGPTYTMSARGLVLSVLPLSLWIYFQVQNRFSWLALCFFCWGLISNLHPLGGWGLVEFLGITILLAENFSLTAWKKVLIMGILTMVGSIPFLYQWLHVVKVPSELAADPAIVKSFWDGFMGLEPPPKNYVGRFLTDLAIPLLIALFGLWSWKGRSKGRERLSSTVGPLPKVEENIRDLKLAWIFPLVVIVMTIVVMLFGNLLKQKGFSLPVMVPEHSRNIKFVYLTVGIWMGVGIYYWIKIQKKPLLRWGVPFLLICISLTLNFPGHKFMRHGLAKVGVFSPEETARLQAKRDLDLQDLEVARWARDNTPKGALFYFDSYEFRYYSRRSLVFCWFDRPCVGFRPTKDLEEWIRRQKKTKSLKDQTDSQGMVEAAKEYHADYLVLLNSWKPIDKKPIWSNQKYSVYLLP